MKFNKEYGILKMIQINQKGVCRVKALMKNIFARRKVTYGIKCLNQLLMVQITRKH